MKIFILAVIAFIASATFVRRSLVASGNRHLQQATQETWTDVPSSKWLEMLPGAPTKIDKPENFRWDFSDAEKWNIPQGYQ